LPSLSDLPHPSVVLFCLHAVEVEVIYVLPEVILGFMRKINCAFVRWLTTTAVPESRLSCSFLIVCQCRYILVGTLKRCNGFYAVKPFYRPGLHQPTFFLKKTNSVRFISLFFHGDFNLYVGPHRVRKTRPHTQHTMIRIQNMVQLWIYRLIQTTF